MLFHRFGLGERARVEGGGIRRPGGEYPEKIDHRGSQQPDQHTNGPRLLRFDDAITDDLVGQQVRADRRDVRRLQREPIGGSERELMLLERRGRQHRRPLQGVELVEPLHIKLQLLAYEVGQPAELGRISHQQHLGDGCRPIGACEVIERSLQLRGEFVEHRLHRLENGLRVLRLDGIPLQVFRPRKRELHPLHERLGEVAAARLNTALPDSSSVGDHEVCGVHPHRHERDGRDRRVGVCGRGIGQLVEYGHVGQCDRGQLQEVDVDARLLKGRQRLENLLAFHRKQGHLSIEHEPALLHPAGQPLPTPDHLLQRKRDLLPRLVLHDVGNLLGLDRRQFDEL